MKDCLIIGACFAITYKEIIKIFKNKALRGGYNTTYYMTGEDGNEQRVGECFWYTTLTVDKDQRQRQMALTKTYDSSYKTYDNYPAIEVGSYKDIPIDYDGVMGVPITILERNLDDVEIVVRGGDIDWATTECGFYTPPTPEQAEAYKRDNETWRIQNPYLIEHDKPVITYNRVFIQLEGLLYGEYTDIDGEYIKGHRPVLEGRQMYSRALIRKADMSQACASNAGTAQSAEPGKQKKCQIDKKR